MKMPGDIFWKCFLYGVALFLTPFVDKIAPILFQDQWPTVPKTIGCILLGTVACSIGLRAYFDGSYERSKNGNGNGSNGGTDTPPVVVPPVVPPKV